jgi:hypothetical protein
MVFCRIGARTAALVIASALSAPTLASGQGASTTAGWKPSLTSWGHPDLQGLWKAIESDQPPPQPKPTTGGGGVGAGPEHWYEAQPIVFLGQLKIVDPPEGKIPPLTSEGQQRAKVRNSRYRARPGSYDDMVPWDRCITRGVPGSMIPINYNNNYQFFQTPDTVGIAYEMIHDVRIIPINSKPHLTANVRQWMGDSRGRWEGNSLVIETTNFTDKTRIIYGDGDHSEQLRLTERFTPVDATTMRYEFTVNDPGTWTKPWTAVLMLKRGAKTDQIYEYACHEGNYAMPNTLSGARAEERAEAAAKAKP